MLHVPKFPQVCLAWAFCPHSARDAVGPQSDRLSSTRGSFLLLILLVFPPLDSPFSHSETPAKESSEDLN